MTIINGQPNLVRNNYNVQNQLATLPKENQEEVLKYLYGTGATDEVIINTKNNTEGVSDDGKDDGKISVGSAVGSMAKGVVDTIGNGIKGMFTNKEGKFSLGKTLLSIGTAALCIAVPAVGVAACVVGGTMGAVQVGKGIYNAATAETDTEAKEAFENIGGGTFTVAASVVGAKAGMKAVKTSSTAGLSSGNSNQLALRNSSSNKLALPGTSGGSTVNTSALGNLSKNATFTQKMSALGKDMISSTQNNYSNIKTTAQNYGSVAKWIYDVKQYTKQTKGQNLLDDGTNTAFKDIAKRGYDLTQNEGTRKAAQNIASGYKLLTQAKNSVTKANAQKLWTDFRTYIKSTPKEFKKVNLSEIGKNLSGTASKIYTDMINGNTTYAQAVQKYGYQNVAEVINAVAGTAFAV